MTEPAGTGPTAEPGRTGSRGSRRLVLGLGVLASVAVVGVGAVGVVNATTPATTSEQALSFDPQAPRLVVELGSGDVALSRAAGDQVDVRRTVRSRGGSQPSLDEQSDPDGVRISAECSLWFGWGCEVDYEIAVPDGFTLDLRTSSGSVDAGGVTAATTTVSASSGDVELVDVTGPIVAEANSGSVTGERLDSPSVSAVASSGAVTLDFATTPGAVTVEASSGDVTLSLPATDGPYAVDVATSSGKEQISVPADPASPRRISVEASSGDVEVRTR
jgi:hypothetical protein